MTNEGSPGNAGNAGNEGSAGNAGNAADAANARNPDACAWFSRSHPVPGPDPVGSLEHACLAVRPPGPQVCRICCGPLERPGSIACRSCRILEGELGKRLRPVTPVSLTTIRTGLYAALKQYKGRPNSISRRQQLRLAQLLSNFFESHEGCVAPGGFDVVVAVPSRHRPAQEEEQEHPLGGTLRMVPCLAPKVADAIVAGSAPIGRNRASARAYRCMREEVEGRRVLLVDDTYTSGAHLHSAAAALEEAGASAVHQLVVGRHQGLSWPPARPLLEWAVAGARRWSTERCVRCACG